jgi:hypothetical protein
LSIDEPQQNKTSKFKQIDKFKLDLPKFISCFTTNQSENTDVFSLEKNLNLSDKQILGSFLFAILLRSKYAIKSTNLNDFESYLRIKRSDLCDLLCSACLFSNKTQLIQSISNLHELIKWLSGFDQEEQDVLTSYLPVLRNLCENTSNITNGLLLAWVFRSLFTKLDSNSFFNSQIDTLNTLIDRLYCLIKLSILFSSTLSSTKSSTFVDEDEKVTYDSIPTLRSILSKQSKGVLTELIAKFIVHNEISPKLLTIIDPDLPGNSDENAANDMKTSLSKTSDFNILDLTIDDMSVLLKNDENKIFYGKFAFQTLDYDLNRCLIVFLKKNLPR